LATAALAPQERAIRRGNHFMVTLMIGPPDCG
jgi:hypothetical protein